MLAACCSFAAGGALFRLAFFSRTLAPFRASGNAPRVQGVTLGDYFNGGRVMDSVI